ncbi:MAG: SurA N-terminal domain-containing protein [Deltaproteobacteria bacterium]|nr:SurA N-terminal domain-containing protein [Deltaproteobacteria bacterium]
MLESIRKRKNSIVIVLAFAAIILVFVFWGVGPSGNKKTGDYAAATIDGEQISMREYGDMYKRHVDYYKSMFKEQFSDELAKKMNLKQKAIEVLINRKLAIRDAAAKGIDVTEAELQDAIKKVDAFKKDGAFDMETYRRVLEANRMKTAEFEKSMRDDLLYSKIQDKITKDVTVSDADAKEAFIKDNRKYEYDYVAVDPEALKKTATVSDEEAKEYLKKNGSAFMEPLRVNAFWAKADISAFEKKVSVTDAEIKEYYGKNQRQFERPASVAARHILIKPDPKTKDPKAAKEAAKAKAEEILKKIKAGADFAALAKKNSGDTASAVKGGDLGWFPRGMMVKPFEEAAFSLRKGEVSGVVESDFGFHVIKVYDRKEAETAPLAEVAVQIKSLVTKEKAWKLASEAALALDKPFRDAKTADELKKAASSRGFASGETGLFSEADKKVEFASVDALREGVFPLHKGDVSKPLQTPLAFYVVKVIEREDPRVQDYAKAAPAIKTKLVDEKADAEAKKKAEEILKKAATSDLAAIAKAEKLKAEPTGPFSKLQPFIQKLSFYAGDKPNFFEATKEKPLYPEVVKAGKRYAVLKLKSAQEANLADFDKTKDRLKQELLAKKQNDAVEAWVKALREKAKVEVFTDKL